MPYRSLALRCRFGPLAAGLLFLAAPAGGWQLEELDGLVHNFDNLGLWRSSTDRFGNAKTATYTAGVLTGVTFPDGRSESFTYHPTGKLATITEVGVAGAATRAWGYTWVDDDLVRIDLPDGQAMELFYEDLDLPGYLTRVERVGAFGERRVEQAWEYDSRGNVVATWKGDELKTGPTPPPPPNAPSTPWTTSATGRRKSSSAGRAAPGRPAPPRTSSTPTAASCKLW